MKKIKILSLICGCLILGLMTGCGKDSENSIKKLNVDLEKYDLPCGSGEVCNEVKGKIVQIDSYEGSVNNVLYSKIILTSDGNIYLYNALSEKMVKINGTTELTHIDGVLPASTINASNSLLYENNNYYSLATDGNITKVSFDVNLKTILSYGENLVWGLDENNILTHYVSCNYMGKQCTSGEKWIKIEEVSNLNLKIKDFNLRAYITQDNKMYLRSLFNYNPLTNQARILNENERNEKIIISDVSNSWYWDDDGDSYGGNLIVQTSDGNLHHNWGSFYSDKKFETTITFNEEVKNVLYVGVPYYFLIIGKDNVYFARFNFDDKNYDLTKLDELKKYKNDIRSLYMRSGIAYVLLSDGNLYKVYEN